MVALGAEKDGLITLDKNNWWELSGGWLSAAFVTLYLPNIQICDIDRA
jgi:uncharacterized membrane protein YdcZ (DUF606 family)